jgi:hypothetical protein
MDLVESQTNVREPSLLSEVALHCLDRVRSTALVGPDFSAVGQAIHTHLAIPEHIDTDIRRH